MPRKYEELDMPTLCRWMARKQNEIELLEDEIVCLKNVHRQPYPGIVKLTRENAIGEISTICNPNRDQIKILQTAKEVELTEAKINLNEFLLEIQDRGRTEVTT